MLTDPCVPMWKTFLASCNSWLKLQCDWPCLLDSSTLQLSLSTRSNEVAKPCPCRMETQSENELDPGNSIQRRSLRHKLIWSQQPSFRICQWDSRRKLHSRSTNRRHTLGCQFSFLLKTRLLKRIRRGRWSVLSIRRGSSRRYRRTHFGCLKWILTCSSNQLCNHRCNWKKTGPSIPTSRHHTSRCTYWKCFHRYHIFPRHKNPCTRRISPPKRSIFQRRNWCSVTTTLLQWPRFHTFLLSRRCIQFAHPL